MLKNLHYQKLFQKKVSDTIEMTLHEFERRTGGGQKLVDVENVTFKLFHKQLGSDLFSIKDIFRHFLNKAFEAAEI